LSVAWDLSALLCPWITADVTCAAVSSVLARALLLASCKFSRPDWAPPSTHLIACTARKAMPKGIRQRRNRWIEIQTTDKFRQNSSDIVLRNSGLTGSVVEAWALSCFDEKYWQNSTRIVTEPDAPVQTGLPSSLGPIVSAALRFLLHCQLQ